MRLEGKVAIVTGSSMGIGLGIAKVLAKERASLVMASRGAQKGKAALKEVRDTGCADIIYVQTDVSKAAEVNRLVSKTMEHYGKIDVLCNNAGIGLLKSVINTSEEEWDEIIDTNLKSIYLCCKAVIPKMIAAGGGSIINIASVASFVGFKDDAAYCASKGGLLMLSKQMALDYSKHDIRVNCICPGFIQTPMANDYFDQHDDPVTARRQTQNMHPLGRLGTPEDIGYAALYLASDESSFVTGTSLVVDGGLLARP